MDRLAARRDAVLALLGDKELAVLALASDRSGTQVRILEAPAAPLSPVWPRPVPVLFGGACVGLLGGLGLALAVHRRRPDYLAADRAGREPALGARAVQQRISGV
jgi:uncharacterized protein involved in exopolysaccharide biosynthesis